MKVRMEDGTQEAILSALNRLSSVEKALTLDADVNRFEIHTKAGQTSKREVFRCCMQNGWVLTESIPAETRLEDIFRNLTMN